MQEVDDGRVVQVNIQGKLAERMLESSIRDTDASAGLKGSQSAQINQNMDIKNQKLPFELNALSLANLGTKADIEGKGLQNQQTQFELNRLSEPNRDQFTKSEKREFETC